MKVSHFVLSLLAATTLSSSSISLVTPPPIVFAATAQINPVSAGASSFSGTGQPNTKTTVAYLSSVSGIKSRFTVITDDKGQWHVNVADEPNIFTAPISAGDTITVGDTTVTVEAASKSEVKESSSSPTPQPNPAEPASNLELAIANASPDTSTITGKAKPDQRLTVIYNGPGKDSNVQYKLSTTTTADKNGDWSLPVAQWTALTSDFIGLGDGGNIIIFSRDDAVATQVNHPLKDEKKTFTVNPVAPYPAQSTITGTAAPNQKLTIYYQQQVGKNLVYDVTADNTGHWSLAMDQQDDDETISFRSGDHFIVVNSATQSYITGTVAQNSPTVSPASDSQTTSQPDTTTPKTIVVPPVNNHPVVTHTPIPQVTSPSQSASTTPSQVQPAATKSLEAGTVIINYVNHYGVAVWNSPNPDQRVTGQLLPSGTAWHYSDRQTDVAGNTWYHVGRDQWLSARYTLKVTPVTTETVGEVQYVPGYGIAVWQSPLGYNFIPGKKLIHGSKWRVFAEVTQTDGSHWYNLGGQQWVSSQYFKLKP